MNKNVAMRLLVITTFYAPDLGAGAALYTMLCEDLVAMGHQVSVIAAVPHYPSGRVADGFRGRLLQREVRNGVQVTRVWVPSVDRSRLWQRLSTFLVYQLLASIVGLRGDYDLVLAGNPALEVFLPFAVLSSLRRKPAIFSVHDLYPDAGIKLGVFRNRAVIKLVGGLEDYCLRQSRLVRVLSDGFERSLICRGLPAEKIVTIWDWLDTDFVRPGPRRNAFSKVFDLDSHFVVQYAGNLGLSQGLEHVLEAASLLACEPALRFVFVGDGAAKEALVNRARDNKLNNVQFIAFQPREKLPEVLAASDLGLISLKRGVSADSVPSKLYSILASGRAVIAAVDHGSDTAGLIERAQCGLHVEPENADALAAAIATLYRNQEERGRMAQNGRAFVVEHHGRQAAARQFDRLVRLANSANG